MFQSVRDGFLDFSRPLEGQVDFMYLDVKSLVSTGVGNLLDADDSEHFGTNPVPLEDIFTLSWFDRITHVPADRDGISDEYRVVKFSGTAHASLTTKESITHLRIDVADINALVGRKLDAFETFLRGRPDFAGYDGWPADAQLGLLSMAWALGPAFHFPRFQAAAAAQDWDAMAVESHMDEAGNWGLVPRNVRNALLFTLAGWNAADPPGDFSLLVFDPTLTLDANMRAGTFPVPLGLDVGLQTALALLADVFGEPLWNPGGLDGVIGTGTRKAVLAYQSSRGLPSTPHVVHVADVGGATIDMLGSELDDQGYSHWP